MSKHRKKHKDGTHHHVHPKEVRKKERKPLRFTLGQMVIAVFMTALVMTVAALVYKIVDMNAAKGSLQTRIEQVEQRETERVQDAWQGNKKTQKPGKVSKRAARIDDAEAKEAERLQKLWGGRRK